MRRGRRCTDGVKNGTETDVDCGGGCAPCATGKGCDGGSDCASGLCSGGVCAAQPTCSDGVKNGNETDVDCGGGTCTGCANGKSCNGGSDCASGLCSGGVCAAPPTCTDGVKNGNETDVDCGGAVAKTSCAGPADCASGFTCAASVCKKADGQTCTGGGECASGNCVDGFCCNTPCPGNCNACSSALKNGVDGVCGTMPNGVACKGGSGICNGAGGCSV